MHALPQVPQCSSLLLVSTHTWPQLTRPAAHEQTPATQSSPPVQTVLQAPQWVLLVCVSTHDDLQSVCPGPHTHTPPEQEVLPRQATPHAPQFRLSQQVETQPPAQTPWAGGQLAPHCADAQSCPGAQAWPQAPQLAGLD